MTVLIPAYEPDDRLLELIGRLKAYTNLPIVVVDDGSGESYKRIFQAVKEAGCTVLTHLTNQGKGRALKTGFQYIQESGQADGVVCADSDGQHLPEDIVRIAETLRERDNEIILGSRQFTGKVPLRSRFGNTMTRLVYSITTGMKIYDTQTGLRGYSAKMLSWLCRIPGERFEYEMNLLLEAKAAGYSMHEVPIQTVYVNENKSSHFRPIADSLRVYIPVLKFSLSSMASTVIDYLLLFLLQYMSSNLLLSVVGARVVSALVNYSTNRKYVFAGRQDVSMRQSLSQYAALAVLILWLNYGLLHVLYEVWGLPLLPAKVLTEASMFLFSYWSQKRFIFKSS
jgi:glycosyltransferase involved in cell wall biosynthesis